MFGRYPLCTNDTMQSTADVIAFTAEHGFRSSFVAIGCVQEAATFCSRDVAFRECPLLVNSLRPTEFPFSVDMPAAQVLALGEIKQSVSSLAGCTNCFADLLNITADVSEGALASFTLRQSMSSADAAMSHFVCGTCQSAGGPFAIAF